MLELNFYRITEDNMTGLGHSSLFPVN